MIGRKNQNYILHKIDRKNEYGFSEGEGWVNSAFPVKEMLQERDKIMWAYFFFGKIKITTYIKLIGKTSMDSVRGRLGKFGGSCEGNVTRKR